MKKITNLFFLLVAIVNISYWGNSCVNAQDENCTGSNTAVGIICIQEYLSFLNSVAVIDDSHGLYDAQKMSKQILQLTSNYEGSLYSYVSVKEVDPSSPMRDLEVLQAMRFCNWKENSKNKNVRDVNISTETGSYFLHDNAVESSEEGKYHIVEREEGLFEVIPSSFNTEGGLESPLMMERSIQKSEVSQPAEFSRRESERSVDDSVPIPRDKSIAVGETSIEEELTNDICSNIYQTCLIKVASITHEAASKGWSDIKRIEEEEKEWTRGKELANQECERAKIAWEEATVDFNKSERELKEFKRNEENKKMQHLLSSSAEEQYGFETGVSYLESRCQFMKKREQLAKVAWKTSDAYRKAITNKYSNRESVMVAEREALRETEEYEGKLRVEALEVAKVEKLFNQNKSYYDVVKKAVEVSTHLDTTTEQLEATAQAWRKVAEAAKKNKKEATSDHSDIWERVDLASQKQHVNWENKNNLHNKTQEAESLAQATLSQALEIFKTHPGTMESSILWKKALQQAEQTKSLWQDIVGAFEEGTLWKKYAKNEQKRWEARVSWRKANIKNDAVKAAEQEAVQQDALHQQMEGLAISFQEAASVFNRRGPGSAPELIRVRIANPHGKKTISMAQDAQQALLETIQIYKKNKEEASAEYRAPWAEALKKAEGQLVSNSYYKHKLIEKFRENLEESIKKVKGKTTELYNVQEIPSVWDNVFQEMDEVRDSYQQAIKIAEQIYESLSPESQSAWLSEVNKLKNQRDGWEVKRLLEQAEKAKQASHLKAGIADLITYQRPISAWWSSGYHQLIKEAQKVNPISLWESTIKEAEAQQQFLQKALELLTSKETSKTAELLKSEGGKTLENIKVDKAFCDTDILRFKAEKASIIANAVYEKSKESMYEQVELTFREAIDRAIEAKEFWKQTVASLEQGKKDIPLGFYGPHIAWTNFYNNAHNQYEYWTANLLWLEAEKLGRITRLEHDKVNIFSSQASLNDKIIHALNQLRAIDKVELAYQKSIGAFQEGNKLVLEQDGLEKMGGKELSEEEKVEKKKWLALVERAEQAKADWNRIAVDIELEIKRATEEIFKQFNEVAASREKEAQGSVDIAQKNKSSWLNFIKNNSQDEAFKQAEANLTRVKSEIRDQRGLLEKEKREREKYLRWRKLSFEEQSIETANENIESARLKINTVLNPEEKICWKRHISCYQQELIYWEKIKGLSNQGSDEVLRLLNQAVIEVQAAANSYKNAAAAYKIRNNSEAEHDKKNGCILLKRTNLLAKVAEYLSKADESRFADKRVSQFWEKEAASIRDLLDKVTPNLEEDIFPDDYDLEITKNLASSFDSFLNQFRGYTTDELADIAGYYAKADKAKTDGSLEGVKAANCWMKAMEQVQLTKEHQAGMTLFIHKMSIEFYVKAAKYFTKAAEERRREHPELVSLWIEAAQHSQCAAEWRSKQAEALALGINAIDMNYGHQALTAEYAADEAVKKADAIRLSGVNNKASKTPAAKTTNVSSVNAEASDPKNYIQGHYSKAVEYTKEVLNKANTVDKKEREKFGGQVGVLSQQCTDYWLKALKESQKNNMVLAEAWRKVAEKQQQAVDHLLASHTACSELLNYKKQQSYEYSSRSLTSAGIALAQWVECLSNAQEATRVNNKKVATWWSDLAGKFQTAGEEWTQSALSYEEGKWTASEVINGENEKSQKASLADIVANMLKERVECLLEASNASLPIVQQAWNERAGQLQFAADLWTQASKVLAETKNKEKKKQLSCAARSHNDAAKVLKEKIKCLVNAEGTHDLEIKALWNEVAEKHQLAVDRFVQSSRDYQSGKWENGENSLESAARLTECAAQTLEKRMEYVLVAKKATKEKKVEIAMLWHQVVEEMKRAADYYLQGSDAFIQGNKERGNFLGNWMYRWGAASSRKEIATTLKERIDCLQKAQEMEEEGKHVVAELWKEAAEKLGKVTDYRLRSSEASVNENKKEQTYWFEGANIAQNTVDIFKKYIDFVLKAQEANKAGRSKRAERYQEIAQKFEEAAQQGALSCKLREEGKEEESKCWAGYRGSSATSCTEKAAEALSQRVEYQIKALEAKEAQQKNSERLWMEAAQQAQEIVVLQTRASEWYAQGKAEEGGKLSGDIYKAEGKKETLVKQAEAAWSKLVSQDKEAPAPILPRSEKK